MIVGVEADPAAVAIGSMPASIPVGTPAITGVALGVVICAAESVLFRSLFGVAGPGPGPFLNRLIAPNQAYVLVGGWILAAAAGVLFAAARSGVVGWSTRPDDRSPSSPAPDPADGTAVMAAIGLVLVAVPLSILAVSGGPGAIPAWRAGFAGATAAAIGGALALAARRLPVARIVALAYAVSFWTEILAARVVGRLSTSPWVEGSAGPAGRASRAMAFSSTWAVAAYAAAGALGAAAAILVAARQGRQPGTASALAAALTPTAGVITGLLVAGLATPATLHLSTQVASRLAAGLAAAAATVLLMRAELNRLASRT